MSEEAKTSIDRLFDEDFKPAWLAEQEAAERKALDDLVTTDVEFAYRQAAKESRERIAAKYGRRQPVTGEA